MTRAVAVIQARLGSRRFPQKMLADLAGHTLIEWVVRRVQQSTNLDRIVVATTREPLDDLLDAECSRLGIEVARGSTNDVLQRFIDAIADDPASEVVRVCADNPFIDPWCIDQVIREYRDQKAEYAFNHRPFGDCNYADGFGAEVISRDVLMSMNTAELSTSHREHVTLAIVDETVSAVKHGCRAPSELARPELSFDIDEPDDLSRLTDLVVRGKLSIASTAVEVIRAADEHVRA